MKPYGYDPRSRAVSFFLENTKLRKCPRRNKLVLQIESSPRPMLLAKRLLDQYGANTVSKNELAEWKLKHITRHGPIDPVFRLRFESAAEKADRGALPKREFQTLKADIRACPSPWSDEDKKAAKAEGQVMLIARGDINDE